MTWGADVRGGCMGGGNVEYWYASAVGYPPYVEIDKRVYAYAFTPNFSNLNTLTLCVTTTPPIDTTPLSLYTTITRRVSFTTPSLLRNNNRRTPMNINITIDGINHTAIPEDNNLPTRREVHKHTVTAITNLIRERVKYLQSKLSSSGSDYGNTASKIIELGRMIDLIEATDARGDLSK